MGQNEQELPSTKDATADPASPNGPHDDEVPLDALRRPPRSRLGRVFGKAGSAPASEQTVVGDASVDIDELAGGSRSPGAEPPSRVTRPAQVGEVWDPERHREIMRGQVAKIVLAILAAVIGLGFATLWAAMWLQTPAADERPTRLLEMVLGPLITLAGAVTAFYYAAGGSGRSDRR